jgi:translocator protein
VTSIATRPLLGWLRPWQLAVVLATLLAIAVNVLANVLPIAGRTTGEISDAFPSLVTPAGYVFSIWGLIYLGLVGFAVWQALPAQADDARLRSVAAPVVVGHLTNALWIVAWHTLSIGLSLVLMLVLLASLIITYLRLRRSRATTRPPSVGPAERLLARGTFSVYLGWITVATVANVTIWLMDLGFERSFLLLPASLWGAVTLLLATGVGIRMLSRYRDLAFAAVLVWAFVGIVVMQRGTVAVAGTAVVGVLALVYAAALQVRRAGYTGST